MRADLMAGAAGWQSVVLEGPDAVVAIPEWDLNVQLGLLYRGTPLERQVQ